MEENQVQQPEPNAVMGILQQIADGQKALAESQKAMAEAMMAMQKPAAPAPAPVQEPDIEKRFDEMWEKKFSAHPAEPTIAATGSITKESRVRVKEAAERFDGTRKTALYPMVTKSGAQHPLAGQPVRLNGRTMEHSSERQRAACASWLKWLKYGENVLSGQEKELVQYLIHHEKWVGTVGGEDGEVINGPLGTKATVFINDSTSGGSYAVPDVFDADVVMIPLLQNELFPFVDITELARGNAVDGVTFGEIALVTGTAEGTAVTAQNTASLIGNLDTTIYPVRFAVELGRDWQSDTPINWAAKLTEELGNKLGEWLDEKVMNGTGSSQPTGITYGTGYVSVSSANGTDGPFTVGDAESLCFGVTKAYRKAKGGRCRYIMNDQTYKRFRAVPVGTSDARRVFGMDHQAYTLLDYPVSIVEGTADGTVAFGNLAYYKMYRRLGMEIRMSDQGRTSMLQNSDLLVFHARYGGQPRKGAAFAIMTTGAMTG